MHDHRDRTASFRSRAGYHEEAAQHHHPADKTLLDDQSAGLRISLHLEGTARTITLGAELRGEGAGANKTSRAFETRRMQ